MKIFFLTILFFQNIICNSQTFNGLIKYDDNLHLPVEYASLLNKNNFNYSYTDSLGNFSINAKINDTIEISHVNSFKYKYIVKKYCDTILIPNKNFILKEAIVTAKTNRNIDFEDSQFYGLSTLNSYAVKINFNYNLKERTIKKISIPIKFKKKFNNLGKLKIQIVNNLHDNPFFEPIIISINEIKNNNEIIIDLSDEQSNVLKNDFFILFDRIIENRTFKKNESLSVNPFFMYKETLDESNLFIKNKYIQKWIKINNKSFGINPKFDFNLQF